MVVVSFRLLSSLCCLFIIILSQIRANQYCDSKKGNYTMNSTYQNNLNTLLSSFSTHTEIYDFYNISYGQDPDKVYAIGLCRGDKNTDECLICLNDLRSKLIQYCPNQKEAIMWVYVCMLRYSNRSIFGVMEDHPSTANVLPNTKNVTASVEQFNEVVMNLMRNLTSTAASGDSRRKYAVDSKPCPNFQTIYGFSQCTPDLSSQDCTKCLDEAISELPQCCTGKAGGFVTKPSCRIRFQNATFYGPTRDLNLDTVPRSTNNISSQVLCHVLFK